jgi:hypothetical protein
VPQETDEHFFAFVAAVSVNLQAVGAEIELPGHDRLLKLATKIRRGNYWDTWRSGLARTFLFAGGTPTPELDKALTFPQNVEAYAHRTRPVLLPKGRQKVRLR